VLCTEADMEQATSIMQQLLVRPQFPCSNENRTRSRKGQPHRDILSAVIDAACRFALDPECAHSVWAEIIRMANQPNPPAPLLGHSSDGVTYTGHEYQRAGVPDVLTFKMLADRLRRRSNAR
jgi:hypothetical protein